ncbi:uncharacterized protein LOC108669355 [Hyalella azteca]|uniref:Uncharacterized protein LOC108669355 n=1 Tax=Hyalella azteca TaxID=294128 RepID=A0A8B7NEX3_HYAAZ|nr:uncharacterized protein LOC108669355 [Hyalella azteca]
MTASFVCETTYRGWRAVEGCQSAAGISRLVDAVIFGDKTDSCTDPKLPFESSRVQLQLTEQQLRLVPLKKDEGFESDSDGSSGSLCDEQCSQSSQSSQCSQSSQVQVIRDHVLRLDKLLRQEGSSPSHKDKITRINHVNHNINCTSNINNQNNVMSDVSGSGNISADTVSVSSSDDVNVAKKEDAASSSSGAESEDDIPAKITNTSPTAHNTSKTSACTHLPALRQTSQSPDGDTRASGATAATTFMMSDILFCHISSSHPKVVVLVAKASFSSPLMRAHVLECLSQHAAKTFYLHYYKAKNKHNLERYRNTKRKTDVDQFMLGDDKENVLSNFKTNLDVFDSLRSCAVRKDSGTSSTDEASSPRGSVRSYKNENSASDNVNIIEVKSNDSSSSEGTQPFSLLQRTDNEGITHIEIESGPASLLNGSSLPPDFSSIISLSTPETNGIVAGFGGVRNYRNMLRTNNNSCPSSLLILERETISSGTEHDRKFRQRQPALLLRAEEDESAQRMMRKVDDDSRSRRDRHFLEVTKHRDIGRPPLPPPSSWALPDRPIRHKTVTRVIEYRDPVPTKNKSNMSPAPTPPPRRHPHDSSLLLVPTKSGQESKRSYYPKESHIVRGNKVVRVDFPTVPVWNHRPDPNNNARQYLHYTGGWAHEYHSPRMREAVLTSELRRRSRSKSPARKPVTNRYLDVVSTFNISQKLREISEAVFSNKRSQGNSIVDSLPPVRGNRTGVKSSTTTGEKESLRPVIKKGNQKQTEGDNRRVTFSAYATVQLMNS